MAYDVFSDPGRGSRSVPSVGDTQGVLSRRVVAYLLDLLFISLLVVLLSFAALVLTIVSLGLLHAVWAIIPFTAIIYSTLTIGSPYAATWGMRIVNIHYGRLGGSAIGYVEALVVTVLFYFSVALTGGLILLLPIFTAGHRALHDILSGMVLVRSEAA